MAALFSAAELPHLRRRHVKRALLAELEFPGITHRLHSGSGKKAIGGFEWRGVGNPNPAAPQLVSVAPIEDARFGAAAKVTITLSGVNREFFQAVHATRAEIEGRAAKLYFVPFDGETQTALTGLKPLFRGQMSSPSVRWVGKGIRAVEVTLEGRWARLMRPYGGKWSYTAVFRRSGGATGGRYIGIEVQEQFL